MFGYVVINQGEMKFKDYDIYRSYYCGLCRSLKEAGGRRSQLTLSYDMTFLVMILTGLYELEPEETICRCITHPVKKHLERKNAISEYCADMNILLTYYKCIDDWEDEKKKTSYLYGSLLKKEIKRLEPIYPEKMKMISSKMKELREGEKNKNLNADQMAGIFGEIMGELFLWKEDEWKGILYQFGFYLGKFIYLMDAYEDVAKDEKEGSYNPFLIFKEENKNKIPAWHPVYGRADFDDKCMEMLQMMMAECARAFELLPIIWYEDILRNILYSGVWTKYGAIRKERTVDCSTTNQEEKE